MDRLTEKQLKVMAELTCSAGASLRDIARRAKMTEATVRNNLDHFLSKGWLKRGCLLNYSALGMQSFNMFFSFSRPPSKTALAEVMRDPRLVWFTENISDPRLEMTVVVRNPTQLPVLIDELMTRSGAGVVRRKWALEVAIAYFGERHLAPGSECSSSTEVSFTDPVPFDLLDLQIMDELRGGKNTDSVASLARLLRQPNSTIKYRIDRLQAKGVISAQPYFLDAAVAGLLECQLVVTLGDVVKDFEKRLRKFCHQTLHVTSLIKGFGNWDFKLIVHAWTVEQVTRVRDELEETFPGAFSELGLITRKAILPAVMNLSQHPELGYAGGSRKSSSSRLER